jgi:hypothetical protein
MAISRTRQTIDTLSGTVEAADLVSLYIQRPPGGTLEADVVYRDDDGHQEAVTWNLDAAEGLAGSAIMRDVSGTGYGAMTPAQTIELSTNDTIQTMVLTDTAAANIEFETATLLISAV